jgi:hypothetical protein
MPEAEQMQDKNSATAGNQWPKMRENGEPGMPKEYPLSEVQQRVVVPWKIGNGQRSPVATRPTGCRGILDSRELESVPG